MPRRPPTVSDRRLRPVEALLVLGVLPALGAWWVWQGLVADGLVIPAPAHMGLLVLLWHALAVILAGTWQRIWFRR